MACQVTAKETSVVVNGYYEMTMVEFIAERVNQYRKRAYHSDKSCENVYKIRVPSRPEPTLSRKV